MNVKFMLGFIKYYLTAQSKHDVHSPFVFSLVKNVILPDNQSSDFTGIEKIRKQLSKRKQLILSEDFGAGHHGIAIKEQTVGAITRNSSKHARYCRLMYRLVKYFKSGNIIELGTSFGISTMYLAKGNPDGSIVTIEGSRVIAEIAESNFKTEKLENIRLMKGRFEDFLTDVLENMPSVDFIYIDGNHALQPTLSYFEQILEKSHKNTIFVIDDINWSSEMQEAWSFIKHHPKVSVTVDLYMLGLVFLNPDMSKENFVIRY